MLTWNVIIHTFEKYNTQKGIGRKLFTKRSDLLESVASLFRRSVNVEEKTAEALLNGTRTDDQINNKKLTLREEFFILEIIFKTPIEQRRSLSYTILSHDIAQAYSTTHTIKLYRACEKLYTANAFNLHTYTAIVTHSEKNRIAEAICDDTKQLDTNIKIKLRDFANKKISIENCLANFYLQAQDESKASFWYAKVIEHRQPLIITEYPHSRVSGAILYHIASTYEPIDSKSAYEYYLLAERSQNSQSLYHLARFYHYGLGGVGKDTHSATQYYMRALQKGCNFSSDRIKEIAKQSDIANKYILLKSFLDVPKSDYEELSQALVDELCITITNNENIYKMLAIFHQTGLFSDKAFKSLMSRKDAVAVANDFMLIHAKLPITKSDEIVLVSQAKISLDACLARLFIKIQYTERACFWYEKVFNKDETIDIHLFPNTKSSAQVLFSIARLAEKGKIAFATELYNKASEYNNESATLRLAEIYATPSLRKKPNIQKSISYYFRATQQGTKAYEPLKTYADDKKYRFIFLKELLAFVLNKQNKLPKKLKSDLVARSTHDKTGDAFKVYTLLYNMNIFNKSCHDILTTHLKSAQIRNDILTLSNRMSLHDHEALRAFSRNTLTIEICLARLFTYANNFKKSCDWYEEAIKKEGVIKPDDVPLTEITGKLLFHIARIIERDHSQQQAILFYQKSSQLNYPSALLYMANLNLQDTDYKNINLAIHQYVMAAMMGCEQANRALMTFANSSEPEMNYHVFREMLISTNSNLGKISSALKQEVLSLCTKDQTGTVSQALALFEELGQLNFSVFKLFITHPNILVIAEELIALRKNTTLDMSIELKRLNTGLMHVEMCLANLFIRASNKEKASSWLASCIRNNIKVQIDEIPDCRVAAEVLFNLGQHCENGQIGEINMTLARQCYSKAAKQQHVNSLIRLAELYQTDKPLNVEQAFECYHKALQLGFNQVIPSLHRLAKEGNHTMRSRLMRDSQFALLWKKDELYKTVTTEEAAHKKRMYS